MLTEIAIDFHMTHFYFWRVLQVLVALFKKLKKKKSTTKLYICAYTLESCDRCGISDEDFFRLKWNGNTKC